MTVFGVIGVPEPVFDPDDPEAPPGGGWAPPPLPGMVLMSVSEGMRRFSGRWRRHRIEAWGRGGYVLEERATPLTGRFRVRLSKSGMGAAFRNSEYSIWLDDMAHYMEQIIIGLRGTSSSATLDIDIVFRDFGSSSYLAQAGPGDASWNPLSHLFALRLSSPYATVTQALLEVNTRYFQVNPTQPYYIDWKERFLRTAIHECFHCVGFGSLWNGPFRIVTPPLIILGATIIPAVRLGDLFPYNRVGAGNPNSARYTASTGLSQWRATIQGQSGAGSIPIETVGMGEYTLMADAGGTALAHWRSGTGYRSLQGQLVDAEIMTTYSSGYPNEAWVGRFSVGSLRDIGWEISYTPLERNIWDYKSV